MSVICIHKLNIELKQFLDVRMNTIYEIHDLFSNIINNFQNSNNINKK